MKLLSPNKTLYLLALVKFILPYLLYDSYYQLHRDEYLYLSEGHHLAWGYLEVPPLLSVFAWITNMFGGGFFWVKLWPNLFGVFTLLLIGRIIISLGGKHFALVIGTMPIIIGGIMRLFFLLHPNFLDVFFWTLMAYGLFKFIQTSKNSWLYVFGIAIGFGMLSKYSSAFYVLSLLAGLIITRHRTVFLNKHFYLAGLLAFIIFLPNLYWQYAHNFPIVNHMAELKEEQLQFNDPVNFIVAQIVMNLPFIFVWIAGLVFVAAAAKQYRVFGWAYLLVISLLVYFQGKDYYALGAYPVLFALGAFYLEKATVSRFAWTRYVMILIPVALSILVMPLILPTSEPGSLANYYKKIGVDKTGSFRWEDQQFHPLPQDFADMIGWREMTQQVATIFNALPPAEQKKTLIYARGYYSAGALNYYGPSLNLPVVHSDNASFLFWMPEKYNIKHLLFVGHNMPEKDDAVFQQFERVTLKDSVNMPLFREHGMKFILFENGNDSLNNMIGTGIAEMKAVFTRK
ncbi:MAG: glycosyltransferase family 39 protein [Bacteroidota bacterium]